jgi:hypothetical protein
MPNKLKVLVVGKMTRGAAYEIAGTVAGEMGKCQADVEVKAISDKELKLILAVLDDEKYRCPEPRGEEGCSCAGCVAINELVKKLTPSPIKKDEE